MIEQRKYKETETRRSTIMMSWNRILTGEQVRDSTESRIRVIRWMII